MGRPPSTSSDKISSIGIALLGGRSKSHTPPFLLTFLFFNKNLHNLLVDSRASSNILPKNYLCKIESKTPKICYSHCAVRSILSQSHRKNQSGHY